MFKNWLLKVRAWKDDIVHHEKKLVLALIFLVIALIFKFVTGFYVEKVGFSSPPDILLDNLPVVDLSWVYVWLFIAVLVLFFAYPLFYKPKKLHYSIGLFSLLLLVRSGFTALTHLKIPADAVAIHHSPHLFDTFSFTNDLFFSGQVGLSFLGFLIYRESPRLSIFMLVSSFLLGVSALFMHIHYSIDILSAFFIAYAVYKIGDYLFRE